MVRGWAGRKRSRCLVGRSRRTVVGEELAFWPRPRGKSVRKGARFTYVPDAGHVTNLPAGGIGCARVSGGSAGLAPLKAVCWGAEGRGSQGKGGDDDLHHFDCLMLCGDWRIGNG
jgi:hypothetical protein